MKPKLVTIKNILRIIISVLIIVSMCQSCAKADTYNLTKVNSNRWTTESILQELVAFVTPEYKDSANIQSFISQMSVYPYCCFSYYTGRYSREVSIIILKEPGYFNTDNTNSANFRINSPNNMADKYTLGLKASGAYDNISYSENWHNFSNQGINWSSPYFLACTEDGYYEGGTSTFRLNNLTPPTPQFNFVFYDTSVTASVPNGETAYCVFLDPIQNYQKIGYVENFEEHKNTQIQIFAQNYRNHDNVLVNSIGENNYILNESGELLVNTNTMWTALVYEIVGIDNDPSGDFLNGQNFTAYYYIGAGSNVSGDPNFYGADYNNNQFFLWKLLGNFGDGSGDNGSGLFGGIGNFFTGIYDKMFKVESGDIYNTLEAIRIEENITNMELLSGELAILNLLTGEPQDFVISWNDISYMDKIIIPQGNINFSQRIRDNETLTTVLNWVHVLMGFSIITIIIQEYWFTLLKMLGVGVSVYEDAEEERARLEEINSTHVYDTMVTTQQRDGSERVLKRYRTYRKRRE